MIKVGQRIKVPEKNRIYKSIKTEETYFIKYVARSSETFIIHGLETDFIPNETIEIVEIIKVGMGVYKTKTGRYLRNVSVYVKYKHCEKTKKVKNKIIPQPEIEDNKISFDELDPDMLEF